MTINQPTDGQGVYEGVNTLSNSATYQPRLQQIAAGGFELVMNYNILHGHIADVIAYINYAASQGLKVIVYLADTAIWKTATYNTRYPELYADSGNAVTGIAFMQYIVGQIHSLAGLWGYYVGDEVAAADHGTLKTYTDAIKTADATHPRLLIQAASDATNSFGASNTAMWDCCDVGGDDDYPIGSTSANSIAGIATQAAGVQSYCTTKGISSAFALQAHSQAPYGVLGAPWPTSAQMVTMRNNALSNMKPRVILWYSYFDVVITGSPNFAPINQWYFLENASDGRSGLVLFPTPARRGSSAQNNFYTQAIVADTPFAYYRLDETSGLVAHDQTSNGYNGTLNATGVTLSQPGAINQDSDTCMKLNNGWITLPANVNGSGLAAFSLEMWFNPSSLALPSGFSNLLMADPTATTNHCYSLFLSGPPIKLIFGVGNGTINVTAADLQTAYTTNTWYQAVGTYDGSTVALFVNGVMVGKATLTGTIGSAATLPVIGASVGHGSTFIGLIDEVSMFSYALGNKAVSHYAAGVRAPISSSILFPAATRRQT